MQVSESIEIIINNTNSKMRILEDGILHNLYSEGVLLEVEDIKELQVQFNLLEPKPTKVLQELGKFTNMSAEARKYAAEHSPELDGVAYVIHNLAQRLLIRFYVRMWKRDKPTKVFDSFSDAHKWLVKL